MQWSDGARIWLWIVLVLNVLSCVSVFLVITVVPVLAIINIVLEIVLMAGVAMLLFKQRKIGFYILCACSIITGILNIVLGVNIIRAVLSAVLFPLITYLFIKNNWNELA